MADLHDPWVISAPCRERALIPGKYATLHRGKWIFRANKMEKKWKNLEDRE